MSMKHKLIVMILWGLISILLYVAVHTAAAHISSCQNNTSMLTCAVVKKSTCKLKSSQML